MPVIWQMDKQMWYIHIVEYNSAIKRKETLIYTIKWMNLENILLSERSQIHTVTCCMIPFIWNIWNRPIHKDKVDCQGMRSKCQWVQSFFLGVMKCSRIRVMIMPQICEYIKNHYIVYFNRMSFVVCLLYPNKTVTEKKPVLQVLDRYFFLVKWYFIVTLIWQPWHWFFSLFFFLLLIIDILQT